MCFTQSDYDFAQTCVRSMQGHRRLGDFEEAMAASKTDLELFERQ